VTREPHFSWLMGPIDQPDPRVGDMSASTANRNPNGFEKALWDLWLNQPVQPLTREDNAA